MFKFNFTLQKIFQISQGKIKVRLDVYSPWLQMKLIFDNMKGASFSHKSNFFCNLENLGITDI